MVRKAHNTAFDHHCALAIHCSPADVLTKTTYLCALDTDMK